ncbi:MAG: type IV pilin N-terminal domain-containing protein, partial [Methanomicrobiales archaeon]|nr:type IV pilin N-terminal domain-containing protein [Methanomicrobiales archaeon]
MDPSGGRRPEGARPAVSEVVGTIVLVGIVVLGLVIVNLVIFSAPSRSRIPSIEATMENQSRVITIIHKGGDSIPLGEFKILINGNDTTGQFTNSGSYPWSIGQTLTWNGDYWPMNAILIYNGTGTGEVVLLETKFPWGMTVSGGQEGSGGSGGESGGGTSGPTWWDCAWGYREKLTVITGSAGVPGGYTVSLALNHAALVSAGKSLATGNDLRVVYWTGTGWTEVSRALDPLSSWGSSSTTLWFPLVGPMEASSLNGSYYLYYGNAAADAPPADWGNIFQMGDTFN